MTWRDSALSMPNYCNSLHNFLEHLGPRLYRRWRDAQTELQCYSVSFSTISNTKSSCGNTGSTREIQALRVFFTWIINSPSRWHYYLHVIFMVRKDNVGHWESILLAFGFVDKINLPPASHREIRHVGDPSRCRDSASSFARSDPSDSFQSSSRSDPGPGRNNLPKPSPRLYLCRN